MTHLAVITAILVLAILSIIHLLVLLKVLPYSIVWGGKLKSVGEMYQKESFALGSTLFFLWVILQKARFVPVIFSDGLLQIILWVMVGLFALSTLGSFTSPSKTEKYLFSTFALLLSVCCVLLALG